MSWEIVRETLRRLETRHDKRVNFRLYVDDSWAFYLSDTLIHHGQGLNNLSDLLDSLRIKSEKTG